LDKPWDWYYLSKNLNLTLEIVKANSDKLNWRWLSYNLTTTWDIVKANLDKPWNWSWLSKNPNITWEIVEANPDKPWNWGWLSMNPNITFKIIESNIDKPWYWRWLCGGLYKKEEEEFERICKHQKELIRKIYKSIHASETNEYITRNGILNRILVA